MMTDLTIIKKEIESKALFRLEEYGRGFRVIMKVFDIDVLYIQISYDMGTLIKSKEHDVYEILPIEIEIKNKLIDEFIENKHLLNKFIQIRRDLKINSLLT